MKELICIICPKGCHLQVDEANDYAVKGNACPRGAAYGRDECLHPTRVLTSTVVVSGGLHSRCPVKSDRPLPKDKLFAIMKLLDDVRLTAPVYMGQVVLENVLDTGINIIATREL